VIARYQEIDLYKAANPIAGLGHLQRTNILVLICMFNWPIFTEFCIQK
jgi:hypothetical protein